MPTTANQQLPYPASSAAPNVPADLQALGQAAEKKVVQVFASATDRTTRMPSPTEGMLSWLQDKNRFDYYTGAAWVAETRIDTLPVTVADFPSNVVDTMTASATKTITLPAGFQGLNIRVSATAVCTYVQASGAGAQKLRYAVRLGGVEGGIQESSTSASGVTERNLGAQFSRTIDAVTSFTVGVAGGNGVSAGGTFTKCEVHVTIEAPRRVSPNAYTGHDGGA